MATTLPGSPFVESSDLVANYPAVSESLAERVDLVGVLPFADSTARGTAIPSPTDGQYSYLQDTNSTEYYNGAASVAAGVEPGLSYITKASFSAATSVSVNNCFTSTYDAYRLVIIANLASGQGDMNLRLRVATVDATTNYNRQNFVANSTTVSGFRGTGETQAVLFSADSSPGGFNTCDIYGPALASATQFFAESVRSESTIVLREVAGQHTTATAYDGFTLLMGSSTGTVYVYGYRKV
jgi:hypothetical protein